MASGHSPTVSAGTRPDQRMVRGARSREKILETALQLLSEEGYGALSISAICKRANVSATSLYHHFGDKAGLLKEMVETALEHNVALLTGSVRGMTDPLERLDAFLEMDRQVFLNDRANCGAVLMALSQARGEAPEVADILTETRRKMWQVAAEEFAKDMNLADGTVQAHLLITFSSYIAMVGKEEGSEQDVDALLNTLRTLFLLTGAAAIPEYLENEGFKKALEETKARLSQRADGKVIPLEKE